MNNIINLIKNFTEEDYKNNVNLHIHSSYSDGECSPEEIIAQAKKLNLKYISIADHNTVNAYNETNISNEEILIPAIEFDCLHKGILIHILGYGIDISNEKINKLCAKDKRGSKYDIIRILSLRNPKDVIQAIHDAGGIAILAHPACYWAISLSHFVKTLVDIGIDGLEVFYPYRRHRAILKFHSSSKVKQIAQKFNLIMTGGTDEHGVLCTL